MEGTIQTVDDRLRINVRLIDIGDGAQIWADSFDETEGDIFKLQDEISSQVTKSLVLNLTDPEKEYFYKRYTQNRDAYEAYLHRRLFFDNRNPEAYEKATMEFAQAVGYDPNYALAYTGLADVYALQANTQDGEKRDALSKEAKARAAASKRCK